MSLGVLCGIPALLRHHVIDLILHTNGVVKCLSKGEVDVCSSRLDSSVHHKIAFSLEVKEKIFHNFLVVHSFSPFLCIKKTEKSAEILILLAGNAGNEIFQFSVGDGVGTFGAKSLDLLTVTEGILDIKEFFW